MNDFLRNNFSIGFCSPICFTILVGDLFPEGLFVSVSNGQGAVFGALMDNALGPDAVGEMCPVVVAFFEFIPGIFEFLLPGLETAETPQRGGGDLDAVIEVGFPKFGDTIELVLEVAQLLELISQLTDFVGSLRVGLVGLLELL